MNNKLVLALTALLSGQALAVPTATVKRASADDVGLPPIPPS